ncbi:MAG: ATP-binding protein [Candidatus Methylomirabilales bacterium]
MATEMRGTDAPKDPRRSLALRRRAEALQKRLAELEARAGQGTRGELQEALGALGEAAAALGAAADTLEGQEREAEEERARLQGQLQRAQRLESIGRLAGGIAHDLNNLLGPILGYAELALQQVEPEEQLHADLREILKLGERARQLGRHLLALGRRQPLTLRVFSLNALLAELQSILRRTIREDISLELALRAAPDSVRGDAAQIEQVLLNLAANAQDAMPGGGTLTIRTENVHVDQAGGAPHPELKPGPYVSLVVSDTGCGMDEETLSHLFEPFFTTKGARGTGLGLASAHSVVRQHAGRIGVESRPQAGTTFRIYLPGVEDLPETAAPPVPAAEIRGGETILVAEDEEGVRNLVSQILVRRGYEVLTARDGEEALRLAGQHRGTIHLLLTDVIMPGMQGPDLFTKLRALRPGVKVLYMSGYSESVGAGRGITAAQMVQKPFSLQALTEGVRRALDGPPA